VNVGGTKIHITDGKIAIHSSGMVEVTASNIGLAATQGIALSAPYITIAGGTVDVQGDIKLNA